MDLSFLAHVNLFAVIVTSIIFFLLGSLWFSFLFRSEWTKELASHNVIIKAPAQTDLITKMALTFGANVVTVLATAYLVAITGSSTLVSGLLLGILVAIGFAATTVAGVFIWENRSLKLFLIDVGYPALGIIVSAIILSLWH